MLTAISGGNLRFLKAKTTHPMPLAVHDELYPETDTFPKLPQSQAIVN